MTAEATTVSNPWDGRTVTWRIDGEQVTATYNPGELLLMQTAKQRGAARAELEGLHVIKALLDATLVGAEAA